MAKEISFEYLNVMEPRLLISDDFRAIYINDAFVEKLEDPDYVQTYARGEYMFSKGDEKVFYLPGD